MLPAPRHYQALIKLKRNSSLVVARFELARDDAPREEDRRGNCPAHAGMDLDPPADLAEQFQLRLGSCYLAKNNPAAGRFALVAAAHSRLWRPMPAIAWARRCC